MQDCSRGSASNRRHAMRTRNTSAKGLTVQAVAGTYVVVVGFDLLQQDCKGLLGFAIERTDQTEHEQYWLGAGQITFPNMAVGPNGETTRLSPTIRTPTRYKPCTGSPALLKEAIAWRWTFRRKTHCMWEVAVTRFTSTGVPEPARPMCINLVTKTPIRSLIAKHSSGY